MAMKKMGVGKLSLMILAATLISLVAHAQDIPFDQGAGSGAQAQQPTEANPYTDVENQTPPPPPVVAPPVTAPTVMAPPTATGSARTPRLTPGELSGLGKLAPFNDIAVISKRFLPKTHRFEFYPDVGVVLNDAFFNDYIFGARLGYYFNENWGLEASGLAISSSQKSVTSELQTVRGVQTQSLATPTSFYGAGIKWDPVYGKLGFMGKKIVPFDFYFLVGAGVTGTNQNTSPVTIEVGAGQLFAIKKWLAARWDVTWYGYNSTTTVGNQGSVFFTNLHATIGASFFFPKAEYR